MAARLSSVITTIAYDAYMGWLMVVFVTDNTSLFSSGGAFLKRWNLQSATALLTAKSLPKSLLRHYHTLRVSASQYSPDKPGEPS